MNYFEPESLIKIDFQLPGKFQWNEDNIEKIYSRFSRKFAYKIDFSAYGLHRDPTPVYELKNYVIGFGWLTKELVQLSNGRAVGILSGSLSTINSKETLDYVTKCCFHHLRALRHDEKTPMLKRVPQMKPQIKNIIQDIVKHQGTENSHLFFKLLVELISNILSNLS